MAVTVKRIGLWRSEVANEPGALARTLEPLAASRASLRVVMGYRFPEHPERAAIEVYPVAGARATAAAQAAGLAMPHVTLRREDNTRQGFLDPPDFDALLGEVRARDAVVADVVESAF